MGHGDPCGKQVVGDRCVIVPLFDVTGVRKAFDKPCRMAWYVAETQQGLCRTSAPGGPRADHTREPRVGRNPYQDLVDVLGTLGRLDGTARSLQRARVPCERTRGRLCVFVARCLVGERCTGYSHGDAPPAETLWWHGWDPPSAARPLRKRSHGLMPGVDHTPAHADGRLCGPSARARRGRQGGAACGQGMEAVDAARRRRG